MMEHKKLTTACLAFLLALVLAAGVLCAPAVSASAEGPGEADEVISFNDPPGIKADTRPKGWVIFADKIEWDPQRYYRYAPATGNTMDVTYSTTVQYGLHLVGSGFIECSSSNSDIVEVADDMHVVLDEGVTDEVDFILNVKKGGRAVLTFTAEETPYHRSASLKVTVNVLKPGQSISIGKTSFSGTCGSRITLGASAKTALSYKSSNTTVATVSSKGVVSLIKPGTASITIIAAESSLYKSASRKVTVTASLKKPDLTATPGSGLVKLTWSQVPAASQYEIYVKHPGAAKFKHVLTKAANVKSVTHSGLKKGYKYSYTMRAKTTVGSKTYYSPFSTARTVTVK